MRRYYQDWLDTFDGITNVPVELGDAGNEDVVALMYVSGRARLSGIATELR